jgi:hypothetical protein
MNKFFESAFEELENVINDQFIQDKISNLKNKVLNILSDRNELIELLIMNMNKIAGKAVMPTVSCANILKQ